MSFSCMRLRGRRALMIGSLFALLGISQVAQGSSAEAWQEFQQDVERACREAVKGSIEAQVVQVDPYGSESYGFAVLVGPDVSNTTLRLVVCVYDKQSQVAEVSSTFDW